MGAHGGAGVSTLAAAGLGGDAGQAWPRVPALPAGVLVVARLSAVGMAAASRAVEVWQGGHAPPGLHLFGLIVVAAGPRRAPQVARDRLGLVAGWVRRVWTVPWVPTLLGVDLVDVATHQPLRTAIPADLYAWATGQAPR
jgi:hypothetical protein